MCGARRRPPAFFFQAEDGIRAATVTGVQTCALPISSSCTCCGACCTRPGASVPPWTRSEERRVGKECRSGWPPGQETKKCSFLAPPRGRHDCEATDAEPVAHSGLLPESPPETQRGYE